MKNLANDSQHYFRRPISGLLSTVVLLFCGFGNCAASFSQDATAPDKEADPRGWMTEVETEPGKIETNRPVPFAASAAQPAAPSWPTERSARLEIDSPGDFIRSQIGLANFKADDDSIAQPESQAEPGTPRAPAALDRDPLSQILTHSSGSVTSPEGIQGSLKFAVLLGALSLAPAIILMTTSYIRVVVVLSLLKQAFGGHQLPPAQILTALSLFLTFLIMTPVWQELKTNAIDPYSAKEIDWEQAWANGMAPIKTFMVRQIELAGNTDSVAVFYRYADVGASAPPANLSEVPINVLIPAFMISELKVAFLLGFQIYLPFLVMDLIVSSVTVSMGMLMLPPQMVSFPLKLILFVLVDGWNLVIGMLLQSFAMMLPGTS